MTVDYDEFGYFADNAAEIGLAFPEPPAVRRISVEVAPGQHVSALRWGSGPVEVVFVHGGAQNAHTWDTTILALGCPNALAVDLPGHGHSDRREDRNYLPVANAEALAAVIEREAPNAAAVVGMSLGGLSAMVLANRHRELVRRLIIVDVTPGTDQTKARRITDFVKGPQSFDSFDALLARTIEHNPGRSESSLRRGVLHNARPEPDGSWVWRYDRIDNPAAADFGDLWDEVGGIACPVLLLIGKAWSVTDDADIEMFRTRQPVARVEWVEGAGHSIQGDQPVALAHLIAGFVPGLSTTGPVA